MRFRRSFRLVIITAIFLTGTSACQSEPTGRSTPVRVSQTPDPGRSLVLPTPLPVATEEDSTAIPQVEPLDQPPLDADPQPAVRYRVDAELDWSTRAVQVDEQVDLRNDTGASLRDLVFTIDSVDTNGDSDRFQLKRIETGAGLELGDFAQEGTQLSVTLPEPLEAQSLLTLRLVYELTVPPIANGYQFGHLGYLGYSDRQLNLGNWFPLLAHYDAARGWISPLQHSVGEQAVRRLADFDITLRVIGAPDGLTVAAPGTVTTTDDEWRIVQNNARELAISLSDQFEMLSTATDSGVEVELYYFAEPVGGVEAAQHALNTAADALELFETLYDQPYAHERMIVVEGDFPDGMEFSGLVFVSRDWFQAWQGIPNDWLTLITAHEVSHQWWYSVVGSDQGNTPYLDEALAIYSELLYFERYLPDHVAWWWSFRVGAYGPTGYVDAAVYDFHSPRVYINAIYLQGALMMQALRDDLGELAFFGWLQRYADQMNGQLATPDDFWGAMSSDEYAATFETRKRYLRNVNVLARSSDLP